MMMVHDIICAAADINDCYAKYCRDMHHWWAVQRMGQDLFQVRVTGPQSCALDGSPRLNLAHD